MTQRKYRIRGARFLLSEGLLKVEYRTGTSVYLTVGDGGTPQYYQGSGPVTLEVDDLTGGQPTVQGNPPAADDDFGSVLTTLNFRGNVSATIDKNFLVVTAEGDPKIADGSDVLPLTDGDLAAADLLTWASLDNDGNPHPPKA